MDIRLQSSLYLRALRICIIGFAAIGVLASEQHRTVALLLLAIIFLHLVLNVCYKDSVRGLHIDIGQDKEEQTRDQKVIIELQNQRRIELSLKTFYCLWWVQILYLSSTRQSVVIVILPDTCSAPERLQLMQILNQRH